MMILKNDWDGEFKMVEPTLEEVKNYFIIDDEDDTNDADYRAYTEEIRNADSIDEVVDIANRENGRFGNGSTYIYAEI